MGEETRVTCRRQVGAFLQTYYAAMSRQLESCHRFYLNASGQLTCERVFRGVTLPWIPIRVCDHAGESQQDAAGFTEEGPGNAASSNRNGMKSPFPGADETQSPSAEFRLAEFKFDPKQRADDEAIGQLQAVIRNSIPAVYSDMRISSCDLDVVTLADASEGHSLDAQVVVVGSIHVSDTPRSALGAEAPSNAALKYLAMFPFIQIFRLKLRQFPAGEVGEAARLSTNGLSTSHIWIQQDLLRYLDSNILHWLPLPSRADYPLNENFVHPMITSGAFEHEEGRPAASQGALPYSFVPSPQPMPYFGNFHRSNMVPVLPYPLVGAPGPQPLVAGDAMRVMHGRYGAQPFVPAQPMYGMNAAMASSNMGMASSVKASDDLPFACTIWVGGLPPGSTEELIRAEFSRFGPVHKVDYRPSRGFAFIVFVSEKARDRAIEQYRSGTFVPVTPHFENAYLKIDYKREFGSRGSYSVYRTPFRYQGRIVHYNAINQLGGVPPGEYPPPSYPNTSETPREDVAGTNQSPVRTPTLPSR